MRRSIGTECRAETKDCPHGRAGTEAEIERGIETGEQDEIGTDAAIGREGQQREQFGEGATRQR